MDSKEETAATLCHQDIYNFPFPHKLWIAVNSISCDFIKWNPDGTQIEVLLVALDNYLNKPLSIFKIKSRSAFVKYLHGYSFQLNKTEERDIMKEKLRFAIPVSDKPWQGSNYNYSEIIMHFSHVHFHRHRIDLLANVRPLKDFSLTLVTKDIPESFFIKNNHLEGDLCYKRIGSYSTLAKAQLKHQLVLNFLSEVKTLEEKLKISELMSKVAKEQERKDDEEFMIELSADLFENPHDSVLYMGDEHRTAYAGFYGNCSNEQVLKFFGPYLPMYENDNNEEGEKRIANLNTSNKPPSQTNDISPTNEDVTIHQSETQNLPTSSISMDVLQENHSILNTASSSLEPIFIPDEDKDEISMDDFIKFKDHTEAINDSTPLTDLKVENMSDSKENEENDTNFRNFFNQYRESLSLLYEKQ